MARDYGNIGSVENDRDSYEEALNYHRKALSIHREIKVDLERLEILELPRIQLLLRYV